MYITDLRDDDIEISVKVRPITYMCNTKILKFLSDGNLIAKIVVRSPGHHGLQQIIIIG